MTLPVRSGMSFSGLKLAENTIDAAITWVQQCRKFYQEDIQQIIVRVSFKYTTQPERMSVGNTAVTL